MGAAWLPPGAADALRLPRRRLATVPYSHATPHTTTPIVGDRFASARECLRFFLRNPVIRSPSSPRALHAGTGIDWLPAAANLTQGPSIATPARARPHLPAWGSVASSRRGGLPPPLTVASASNVWPEALRQVGMGNWNRFSRCRLLSEKPQGGCTSGATTMRLFLRTPLTGLPGPTGPKNRKR